MRIAHFGTFDVENYGDLLFPLILENRLSGMCDEFVHVSPAGGPPLWGDCVPTVDFDTFLRETPQIEGVVIGGGQIIRSSPTPLKTYDRGGISPFVAYPSLWLGAAYIAAREDVPLCWNASGVAGVLPPVASRLARWTASVTDYLSVRDGTSRQLLEESEVEQQIHVVPDTALEISRLWTEAEISEAYESAFTTRDRKIPDRSVAFHVNRRWAGEELSSVAARIDRVCATLDATPVLIAIGPCHGDDEIQSQVAREMNKMKTEPLLIERPQSLREVAACIARSEAYLGSSLHGMITALSFGTPGVLIASTEDSKYDGFLSHLDLSSWMVASWEEAEERAADLPYGWEDAAERASEKTGSALDPHWERLRKTLSSGGETSDGERGGGDKRSALERLPRIGAENNESMEIFQGLVAEDLKDTQAKLQERQQRLTAETQKRKELRQQLDDQSQKSGELRQQLDDQSQKSGELRQQLDNQSGMVRELRQRLNQQSQTLKEEREKTRRLASEKEQSQQAWEDVDRLVYWIQTLEKKVAELRSSRVWRVRSRIQRARNSLGSRLDPKKPDVTECLDETFEQFRAWLREHRKGTGGE